MTCFCSILYFSMEVSYHKLLEICQIHPEMGIKTLSDLHSYVALIPLLLNSFLIKFIPLWNNSNTIISFFLTNYEGVFMEIIYIFKVIWKVRSLLITSWKSISAKSSFSLFLSQPLSLSLSLALFLSLSQSALSPLNYISNFYYSFKISFSLSLLWFNLWGNGSLG